MESQRTRLVATVLLSLGVLINTAVVVLCGLHEMSIGVLFVWVWIVAPYLVGAWMLWWIEKPELALGWLVLPVMIDFALFFSVVVNPKSSTAGVACAFSPLWNLLLFGPLGAAAGLSVHRRRREV
jgi:hypothetical protein